jgi:hypothetical protein
MALRAKIKKSAYDKLSDELKKEYVEDGDEFRLDVDGLEDTGALRRAKDREAQRAKDAEAELESLQKKVDKLETGKAGDVVRLQKKWDEEKSELTTKHTESLSKKDAFITKQLKSTLAAQIASELNPKAPKVFLPHIEARLSVDLTGDDPKIVILGADNKPSSLTAEQLRQEFVANKEFASIIVGSKASGGAGANNNKGVSGAPSDKDNQQPASLSTLNPRELANRIKGKKEAATEDA